jgi:hypothetical protein
MKRSPLSLPHLLPILVITLVAGQADLARALDSDRTISIHTRLAVAIKRLALINFVWGTAGFPKSDLLVAQPIAEPVHNLSNLERVERLDITMEGGEIGMAYHFIAQAKNGRLIVLHHGHACTFDDGPGGSSRQDYGMQRTINGLLLDGFSVLAVFMPRNRPGRCEGTRGHESLFLEYKGRLKTGSPIKFFLEPVAVGLNYLQRSYPNYREFSMVGLSGGGWTTTVYAGIDRRIKLSFPVAGTVPLYLPEGSRDVEQQLADFYKIAGYPDLYVLGSYGSGRKQFQILNRRDDCCFGEGYVNTDRQKGSFDDDVRNYEARVKTTLNNLNSGFFRLYIDEVPKRHMISDNALMNVILPVLNGESNIVTTIRTGFKGQHFCLDVPDYGRSPQNGDPVQIYECLGGSNQQFRMLDDGTIRTVGENFCLDVPDYGRDAQSGDPVQVYQCHGDSNQQFSLPGDGTIRTPQWGGLCLDVPDFGRSPENGDPIQVYQCDGDSNQRWNVNR